MSCGFKRYRKVEAIALKKSVLKEFLEVERFKQALEKCESLDDVAQLFREYAEQKGKKIKELNRNECG